MATKRPEFTWENGFQEVASRPFQPWNRPVAHEENEDSDAYVDPPSVDLVTSPAHNHLGVNVISNWPTLYDGTNAPHGVPSWWKPQEEVDVLICGAGPSGLGLAVSLLRQGVSFRIIDKADGPLACGRADGVQPRFLETAALFGLATEVHEEGPLIDRTAIYKDGEKMMFGRSHQSDSRYRGLHVITQGQIERIYIRDLLRHKSIVERNCTLNNIAVDPVSVQDTKSHPIRATVYNEKTGAEEVIQAKFLVGSDGGASAVRKSINVPFDGVSTDIYWGIMDCIFESDYPHAWIFGVVMSTEHGCCVIIPREDGYIRLYTKLDISVTGPISASRQAKDATFAESGGIVDAHSITPEEVLEQANRIFAPYTLKFASTLSWFSVWKISERVARTYSSPDMRIHLAGDAAHIHSVMGAFGLNASILDVANLGWKLGFAARGVAQLDKLLPTYTSERRKHAAKIIKVSGEYLRFISGSSEKVPDLSDLNALEDLAGSNKAEVHTETHASTNGHANGNGHSNGHTNGNTNGYTNGDANGHANGEINGDSNGDANGHVEGETNGETNQDKKSADLAFLQHFFKTNGQFLLGTDCAYDDSVIAPLATNANFEKQDLRLPIRIKTGVRAPNPRLCFSTTETGYLNDTFVGPSRFHLVVFASSLAGSEVRRQVNKFTEALRAPNGFYRRFGTENFHIVLVVKMLPFEYENIAATQPELVAALEEANATILFDDRSPDEDAHTTYGANHSTGGIAVIRPDLWIGTTCFPGETEKLDEYFAGFMRDV